MCGIQVVKHAHEIYMVYPAIGDLHRDSTRSHYLSSIVLCWVSERKKNYVIRDDNRENLLHNIHYKRQYNYSNVHIMR